MPFYRSFDLNFTLAAEGLPELLTDVQILWCPDTSHLHAEGWDDAPTIMLTTGYLAHDDNWYFSPLGERCLRDSVLAWAPLVEFDMDIQRLRDLLDQIANLEAEKKEIAA